MSMFEVIEGYFERKTKEAAAYDMICSGTTVIPANGIRRVYTGAKVQLPSNTLGIISHRGSLPGKKGLDVITGYLDPDYTKEIFLTVRNNTDKPVTLQGGERIAQCAIVQLWVNPIAAEGERGESGSTGGYVDHVCETAVDVTGRCFVCGKNTRE